MARAASIRPRPGGRGEPQPAVSGFRCDGSFNSATTRRPWRTPSAFRLSLPRISLQFGHDLEAVENATAEEERRRKRTGFNSATTWRPWRTPIRNRQCNAASRCFNSATTWRPWRTPFSWRRKATKPRLQFGHDLEAVENDLPPWQQARYCNTSIRPRPVGRGELHSSTYILACDRGASIRPRPGGRGEPGRRGGAGRARWGLQFGHDLEAVENVPAAAKRLGHVKLQFGHDLEAVENVVFIFPDGRTFGSFNSAPTWRPWRTPVVAAAADLADWASIRPRPGGRGERVRRRVAATFHRCFNSATTWRPWRTGIRPSKVGRPQCASIRPRPGGRGEPTVSSMGRQCWESFNSATTWRPWRTASDSASSTSSPVASIRPRPGGRGERLSFARAIRA